MKRTLNELVAELKPAAIKIGMLAETKIVRAIVDFIKKSSLNCPVVLDPVLRAGAGGDLLEPAGMRVLRHRLLPYVLLVTPNVPEAEALTGMKIRSVAEMKQAAIAIREMGARYVLIKGGHLPGDPTDILAGPEGMRLWKGKRLTTRQIHGTGCMLSSMAAGYLALGKPITEAVTKSIRRVRGGIRTAWPPAAESATGWCYLGS